MNIHEYQAKELFDKFNVPSPKGKVASSAEEAKVAAEELGGSNLVVKAQVHAGGRGKGTFKNGFQGGVHLVNSAAEAGDIAGKMIGEVLVTHQTGEDGRLVRKVLIAQSVDIAKEYYLAILIDRDSRAPVIVVSTEGGVNIEEVAEKTPEKILNENIHPLLGLQPYQVRKLSPAAVHPTASSPSSVASPARTSSWTTRNAARSGDSRTRSRSKVVELSPPLSLPWW